MEFKWKCPYCNHFTTIVDRNHERKISDLLIPNNRGLRRLIIDWIVCPNPDCREYSLSAMLYEAKLDSLGNVSQKDQLQYWNLIPGSMAKIFPDYVPESILQDYNEACEIKDLSPKASATLSRRCLQGMIRDFWGIKKNRLIDEISAIEDKVDPLTWQSIDSIRKIGNIGAHMEKDINLVIDVDTDEASLLIHLIEILIQCRLVSGVS